MPPAELGLAWLTLQYPLVLAHAPERLHDEIAADYTDMIYAAPPEQIETRRKAFIRKWRLRHRPVADCLEEAGDRLFTFTRLPPSHLNKRKRGRQSSRLSNGWVCHLLAAVRTSVGCRFRKRAAIVSFLCQTALIQIKASA